VVERDIPVIPQIELAGVRLAEVCDGIVTGIQIRARVGDIAAYRIIKNP
jgi:hypothetical protein